MTAPTTPAQSLAVTNALFFGQSDLTDAKAARLIEKALRGTHDGELYLEYARSESYVLEDGRIKRAQRSASQGFGLRAVLNESAAYAHSGEITKAALAEAALSVQGIKTGTSGKRAVAPGYLQAPLLYTAGDPLESADPARIVKFLQDIDSYVRGKNAKIYQVQVRLSGEWQAIQIMRPGGFQVADLRPLVRLDIVAFAKDGQRIEQGHQGTGGRYGYAALFSEAHWKAQADEAVRQALAMLESKPAPAGEMPVVLGSGWSGILWHEAVGHGLEGDFHRKGVSMFNSLMGKEIASKGVTVIDDGTIADRRGSLLVDDEGTPTERTVLIEDGKLVGLMQDRLNSRLMGTRSTGSGRRESYQHMPMPRMRNTIMLGGAATPEDIIGSVKHGLYAKSFGGGQVDIVSGRFMFSVAEGYMIENGKVSSVPVKGATLIGSGSESLKKITMIGNDMALDPGVGTCGKAGQGVPVGVGQPTMRLDGLTVGGTKLDAPHN